MAGGEISRHASPDPGNMRPQVIDQGGAQQRRAILAAFAVSYVDQMLIEVDILDTQTTSFVNPQPAAINDLQNQTGRSLDLGKDVPYFIDGNTTGNVVLFLARTVFFRSPRSTLPTSRKRSANC